MQASACAVQADGGGAGAAAERGRGLADAQAFPGDEQDQFPIALAEGGERAGELVAHPEGLGVIGCRGDGVRTGALGERVPAGTAAAVVGEHLAGDAVEVRQRRFRELGAAAPGDEEDLGGQVLGLGAARRRR